MLSHRRRGSCSGSLVPGPNSFSSKEGRSHCRQPRSRQPDTLPSSRVYKRGWEGELDGGGKKRRCPKRDLISHHHHHHHYNITTKYHHHQYLLILSPVLNSDKSSTSTIFKIEKFKLPFPSLSVPALPKCASVCGVAKPNWLRRHHSFSFPSFPS